ncbi:hypothetical protein ID853_02525 [Xenorhabdus sp. Vera]|nr:hypothetical protein [Xenorhabdus sp. Vera]
MRIEHLSGISEFSITHDGKHISYASVQRNAQILTILNAMIRKGQMWDESYHQVTQ